MEAEAVFQRWKECMETCQQLQLQSNAKHYSYILQHLSTTSILLAERRKVQIPIYFASRDLQGAEQNYTESEILILALVHASRRLRRYFKHHPIRVLTNKPIEWALLKPDRSRRIAKWAIGLEEHDIEYGQDNSVGDQASPKLGQFNAPSKKEAFKIEREGRPHMILPNPEENKHFLEPLFKFEVEQQASTK
ncbi:hypothetical protein CTI12_AA552950 [Artemisia annua]|uniref:Reverse transcriptase RNase H-like domain-containing protein n=1 Tax=Artemisia annua TaxID=35608 RepID=A0A2U1KXQ7_ARTAN|nr:hypothetical protein CTI12_AA552950 [Artemisia annua]